MLESWPMNKRTKHLLLLLALALAAGAGWFFLRSGEPSHHGKRLGVWLQELGNSEAARRESAREAIRQIGAKALPLLLQRMDPQTDAELGLRMQAVKAFQLLGPVAQPAIPSLARLLNNKKSASDAARALAAIGPAAVETLAGGLGHADAQVRASAARALGEIGEGARPAVPALIKCLKDEDLNVRSGAIASLERIKHDPETVVPALIDVLKEGDLSVRIAAAAALGAFGVQAKAAVPELTKAAGSKAEFLRDAAAGALGQIDPEAARNATQKRAAGN